MADKFYLIHKPFLKGSKELPESEVIRHLKEGVLPREVPVLHQVEPAV